jgi:hypothetical protein
MTSYLSRSVVGRKYGRIFARAATFWKQVGVVGLSNGPFKRAFQTGLSNGPFNPPGRGWVRWKIPYFAKEAQASSFCIRGERVLHVRGEDRNRFPPGSLHRAAHLLSRGAARFIPLSRRGFSPDFCLGPRAEGDGGCFYCGCHLPAALPPPFQPPSSHPPATLQPPSSHPPATLQPHPAADTDDRRPVPRIFCATVVRIPNDRGAPALDFE